uniref:Uncharacterized protein n=1 Tax=Arundo donax TaxID=35708 RepID=A0A0A9DAM1_ARUDO
MVKRTTFTEQMVCHSGPSNLHYCTRSWEKDGIKAAPPVDGGGCPQDRLWSTGHPEQRGWEDEPHQRDPEQRQIDLAAEGIE